MNRNLKAYASEATLLVDRRWQENGKQSDFEFCTRCNNVNCLWNYPTYGCTYLTRGIPTRKRKGQIDDSAIGCPVCCECRECCERVATYITAYIKIKKISNSNSRSGKETNIAVPLKKNNVEVVCVSML